MSRIEGVPEHGAPPTVKVAYRLCRREVGKVVEPLRVTAHHPRIMQGYGGFEWALGRSHEVDEKLKELAALKAAAMAGCEFCMDIGSAFATGFGVTREQLEDLPRYRDSDRFDELEKLVLDYAAGMTSTPVDVPDALFAELRRRFSEAQLVELTATIAIENYRARFNWAFGIGAQGFVGEGGFCARAERPQPATAAAG